MSRGGRGGGRGGRGGRGGGFSVTHDLIRDNLEDLGIDNFTHVEDRSPPPLYPPIELPVCAGPSEDDLYVIGKSREITSKFQISPYYLSRKADQHDIERYSDIRKKSASTVTALDCILRCACPNAASAEDAATSIPLELMDKTAGFAINKRLNKNRDLDLNKLEKEEQSGKRATTELKDKDGSDAEDAELEEGQEVNEFELDDDYGVDHYASDNEGGGGSDYGGGDDGEAVF